MANHSCLMRKAACRWPSISLQAGRKASSSLAKRTARATRGAGTEVSRWRFQGWLACLPPTTLIPAPKPPDPSPHGRRCGPGGWGWGRGPRADHPMPRRGASPLALLGCWHAQAALAGYIHNEASSAETSIVSGSSGENLACANQAWKAADGETFFGCDGATPGTKGKPVGGWNAGPGGPDALQFLTFDFKQPVTLTGLRFSGAGDKIHDANAMTVEVGASQNGPWTQVGAFEGEAGSGKPNTWSEVWQEFEFTKTTSQHWKWNFKSRHSEWQVWVGEVEWHEASVWGWVVVGVVLLGGGGYVGGGKAPRYRCHLVAFFSRWKQYRCRQACSTTSAPAGCEVGRRFRTASFGGRSAGWWKTGWALCGAEAARKGVGVRGCCPAGGQTRSRGRKRSERKRRRRRSRRGNRAGWRGGTPRS